MYKNREFLALFIIFVLIFSLLSMFTEQRLRAFDLHELVPRINVLAPSSHRGLNATDELPAADRAAPRDGSPLPAGG
jgi:hypothetical protein